MQAPGSAARRWFAAKLSGLAEQLEEGELVPQSVAGLLDTRRIPRHLETQLLSLAERLMADQTLRTGLNRSLRESAARWLFRERHQVSGLARRVVMSWDQRSLVDRLELQVGRDLQFIRINGTLVGGLIGLLLQLLCQLTFSA